MITLLIRYTLDMHKLKDFEAYARRWPEPIRRCGGDLRGYFLPTKLAGPTNFALALIDFPDLASYERLSPSARTRSRSPGQRGSRRCRAIHPRRRPFISSAGLVDSTDSLPSPIKIGA